VALDAVAVIDDSPHERAALRARLPEVMVLGDPRFAVRWQLLTDPAFEVPRITDEARRRSELVRGRLARARDERAAADPAAFRAGLELRATLRRETDDRHLARITELVRRTTQLNTTGEPPSPAALAGCTVYTLSAADRFGDHGLVGACIAGGDLLRQVVVSCRVLGLGLEDLLVRAVARDLARRSGAPRIAGRLIATPRNHPARPVFARCGFAPDPADPERWWIDAAALADDPALPYAIACEGFA
jgi:FkbH-like protein